METTITLIDGRYFEFEGHVYDVKIMNHCENGILRYCSLRAKFIDEETIIVWLQK